MEMESLSAFPVEPDPFPMSRRWSRILLVDDDRDMRSLLADAFRREGYAVEVASDGTRAYDALFHEGARLEDFDLIVSDVRMPGLTGVQLAELVHRSFGPPVVLVSAFADVALADAGATAGAVRIVAKPFDLRKLVAVVRELAPPDA